MSNTTERIAVIGAGGRMGRLACELIEGQPDLELVARIGRSDDLRGVLQASGAEVAIDLTVAGIQLDGRGIGRTWLTDESFLAPDVRDEYIDIVNDQLAWHRVYPNPIPPGGMETLL